MNVEEFREYCLKKKGVEESFPFDDTTLVFKVMNKIFALGNLEKPLRINLKCDPNKAIEFREKYHAVRPGYHMNKKHWNTIDLDGSVTDQLIHQWINHSYDLVIKTLPKKKQQELYQL